MLKTTLSLLSLLTFQTAIAQSELKFTAIEDATVKSGSSSKNYGKSSSLEIDKGVEAFVKFKVTGIIGQVGKAKIRFFVKNGSSNGPSIYTAFSTWQEGTITWKNKPARGSVMLQDLGKVATDAYVDFDVTSVVKADGIYSFNLLGSSTDGTDLSSRQGLNPPQLIISSEASAVTPVPAPTAPTAVAFTSIGSNPPTINGKTYSVQSALKDHSIRRSQNAGIYRFEVREGEARAGKDEGKERSELSAGDYRFKVGTDIWLAYSFMVEPGEPLPGTANVLGQFHAGEGSPTLSMRLPYDNSLNFVLRTGSSSDYDQLVPYVKNDFVRGQWYNLVIHVKFSQDTSGVLQVWLDGKQVINKSNIMLGYKESTENYWKFGIYRSESTKQVEAVQYANMELGTVSLSERILKPKPVIP